MYLMGGYLFSLKTILISISLFVGVLEEAQVPYYDCVQTDPSFEEVKQVVCIERRRPSIPDRWKKDDVSYILTHLSLNTICIIGKGQNLFFSPTYRPRQAVP